jgi:hypothetical protein
MDQTLEPTQVAGFNQFFDEASGTRSWRYGVGLDQRLGAGLFAGVEGSMRKLEVPFTATGPSGTDLLESHWQEYQARGHLLWAPRPWIAARLEYTFDRWVRDPLAASGIRWANTQRLPLGLAFFHPSGLGATATATWLDQRGAFGDFEPFTDGSNSFVLLDAGVSYRLPRRYGTVSLTGTNLSNRSFKFVDGAVNNTNPAVLPARAVFARITLAGP